MAAKRIKLSVGDQVMIVGDDRTGAPRAGGAERLAWLHVAGWHGSSRCAVIVVGETPTRYRVRADGARVRLARRWLEPGDPPALVPKSAVSGRCSFCKGGGTAIAVDAVEPGGRLVNPREAACMCCDGDGNDHADPPPEEWSDPDLRPQTPKERDRTWGRTHVALAQLEGAPSWALARAWDDLDNLLRRATIARNKLAAAGLDPDEEPGA